MPVLAIVNAQDERIVDAQAEREDSSPALLLDFGENGWRRRALAWPTTVVGRNQDCDVRLEAPEISDVHCMITCDDGGWSLHDCDGQVGTRVNGRAVKESLLRDGDLLEIGPFKLKVSLPVVAPGESDLGGETPPDSPNDSPNETATAGGGDAGEDAGPPLADPEEATASSPLSLKECPAPAIDEQTLRAQIVREAVAPLEAEVAEFQARLERLRGENERLRAQLCDARAAVAAAAAAKPLADAQDDPSLEEEDPARELAAARQQILRLTAKLEAEHTESGKRLAALRAELDAERQKVKDLVREAAAHMQDTQAEIEELRRQPDVVRRDAGEAEAYPGELAAIRLEVDSLRAALAEREAAAPPPEAALPPDLVEYEEQLNEFRAQLETAHAEMEQKRLALEDEIRATELQLSRERAEIARERVALDRFRAEVKSDLEHFEREAKNLEKMASVHKLASEVRSRTRSGGEESGAGSLSGRVRDFLRRFADE